MKFTKVALLLGILAIRSCFSETDEDETEVESQDEVEVEPEISSEESPARKLNVTPLGRWKMAAQRRRMAENMGEMSEHDQGETGQGFQVQAPPKPERGIMREQTEILRDYDDLIDGTSDDYELDLDVDDDEDIRCIVDARRPYGTSPKITLTGIRDRFNALLVGYDTHVEEKRANKASLCGWSSPKAPSADGVAKFSFDIDYVSILPQAGTPLSYCALVFSPPVVPKFDMKSVFSKPAMSVERYFASEEHLVKAVKKKSKKVTSCCFIAYPMVSMR